MSSNGLSCACKQCSDKLNHFSWPFGVDSQSQALELSDIPGWMGSREEASAW